MKRKNYVCSELTHCNVKKQKTKDVINYHLVLEIERLHKLIVEMNKKIEQLQKKINPQNDYSHLYIT